MRKSSTAAFGLSFLLASCASDPSARTPPPTTKAPRLPNLVVFFVDDLGYADIGPFGGANATPRLDRLASEGLRFTDFCVPSAVCSASRAALLTGCYHVRVGIHGALGPGDRHGLAPREVTLAELCKQRNYATAIYGKWHLGHLEPHLPLAHGFDEFYGYPYSNDMWPLHPDFAHLPADAQGRKRGYPPLAIYEGNAIADPEVDGADQARFLGDCTARALDFIERQGEHPFFLYLPYAMVHVPLFASEEFAGKSGRGLYADVLREVDDSVGRVLDALERAGVADDTLVVFTSDNGPWLSYGEHAGSAGNLREGKGTMFEGGVRVPMLARWPGRIPAGATCGELASTMDLLPTFAKLIDAELPAHPIDGRDLAPLLFGANGARSPHDALAGWYAGGELQTIRDRRWKLCFPHTYRTLDGKAGGTGGSPAPYKQRRIELSLFDLANDPGETRDVAAEYPSVVAQLEAAADALRAELGDKLQKVEGRAVRPAARRAP
ncbi:MAG: sulfatase [Planctomycetes bacterium]|nr:sulfatase [Planctomycetota bacterium]